MMMWDTFKKAFDTWENAAAQWSESAMKSSMILAPSGALLSSVLKSRAALDRLTTMVWSTLGLATRRDQERTLHALNQMQSRLMDLEEKLADKQTDSAPRKAKRAG